MSQPVRIENDAMAVEVWPQYGGKVSSVVDKADRFELLFSYPAELPERNPYDRPYAESWYAGWDECFPAVGKSPYVGHPYDGIQVPDHGEVYGLPTTAAPTRNGIVTTWHGLRFGYRLARKLYLDGPALVAEYTLQNLAPFPFRFVWAAHALMSMQSPVEIRIDGVKPFHHTHGSSAVESLGEFVWPRLPNGVDLSRPANLPQRQGWKVFSLAPIAEPVVLHYTGRSRALRVEYASEDALPAYWGIWINTGGWNGHHHLAVEPTTGRLDQIDRSIRDGSAGTVPVSGKLDWAMRWSLLSE